MWYASLQPATPEATALCQQGLPEKVASPMEYEIAREKVRQAFQTHVRLLPGSIVGMRPIEVRSRSTIGGLSTKKLKQNLDCIWGSLFNLVLGERALEFLQSLNLNLPMGTVSFQTAEKQFGGYRVLELESQPVWTEAERRKYQVTFCSVCGSSLKGVSRGTFAPKEFDGAIFRDGYVMVRGLEGNGIYVNQALAERLQEAKLTGVSFKRAGSWV